LKISSNSIDGITVCAAAQFLLRRKLPPGGPGVPIDSY
jgi:hypothetical protein